MYNGDLEPSLSTSSLPESSSNPEASAPATLPQVASEAGDAAANSKLEQQLDAAIREVEDLLLRNDAGPRPLRIDSSTPDLAEAGTRTDSDRDEMENELAPDDGTPVGSAEEAEIRDSLRAIEQRIAQVAEARQQAENRLLIKLEAEATLQAQASARRREEEELRRQADEKAARRRHEDRIKLEAQRQEVSTTDRELKEIWTEERRLRSGVVRLNQTIGEVLLRRARAEEEAKLSLLAEAQRARNEADEVHAENLARLRGEEEALRGAIAQLSSRRTELDAERQKHQSEARALEEEKTQLAAAAAARLSEATRIRRQAEESSRLEQEQLAAQEEELARLTEALSQRRAELELARQNAEEDAKRLAEAMARMRAAEESSRQAERERLSFEAQILQRAEEERRMLADARSRVEEQQRQLETSARDRQEREARRMAELEGLRVAAEANKGVYEEKEQALISELKSLQLAAQATQERIEELNVQRGAASETHQRMLEKLKRVEEEARARSSQEAQARTALESRIKEEIEHLRALETEHRQRIDEEISRRTEVERSLLETKARYQAEQAARIKTELQFDLWNEPAAKTSLVVDAPPDDSVAELGQVQKASEFSANETDVEYDSPVGDQAGMDLPVYQVGNLSSANPRLRADAVTALARLGSRDSYGLILNCFDDESSLVRNAAARAMLALEPHRPVEPFTRALQDSSSERCARIGKAISDSGLAAQAINALCGKDQEGVYNGLCLLFTMAKTGEVDALVEAIENHDDAEVRLAAIRLLKLSGQGELASAAVERRLSPNKQP